MLHVAGAGEGSKMLPKKSEHKQKLGISTAATLLFTSINVLARNNYLGSLQKS